MARRTKPYSHCWRTPASRTCTNVRNLHRQQAAKQSRPCWKDTIRFHCAQRTLINFALRPLHGERDVNAVLNRIVQCIEMVREVRASSGFDICRQQYDGDDNRDVHHQQTYFAISRGITGGELATKVAASVALDRALCCLLRRFFLVRVILFDDLDDPAQSANTEQNDENKVTFQLLISEILKSSIPLPW